MNVTKQSKYVRERIEKSEFKCHKSNPSSGAFDLKTTLSS